MRVAAGVAVGLAGGPPSVRAQPGLTSPGRAETLAPAERPAPGQTHSYGLEIFAADDLVTALALATRRGEPVVGILLTGPVIHAAHGRVSAAVGSLFLRAGAPAAAAYVGALTCDWNDESEGYDCFGHTFVGFAIGAAVALGVDYFVLARKRTAVTPARIAPASRDAEGRRGGRRVRFSRVR